MLPSEWASRRLTEEGGVREMLTRGLELETRLQKLARAETNESLAEFHAECEDARTICEQAGDRAR
eukprot:6258422-Prorocentrum_lima.AAC.1